MKHKTDFHQTSLYLFSRILVIKHHHIIIRQPKNFAAILFDDIFKSFYQDSAVEAS